MGASPPRNHIPYATDRAISDALVLGWTFGHVGWSAIFLAITDAVAVDEVPVAPAHVTAVYRGQTRTHERWAITLSGQSFDVLYSPDNARIEGVIGDRGAVSAAAPAPVSNRHGAKAAAVA